MGLEEPSSLIGSRSIQWFSVFLLPMPWTSKGLVNNHKICDIHLLDTVWYRRFSGSAKWRKGVCINHMCFMQMALILMGDWCSEISLTSYWRNKGRRKKRIITGKVTDNYVDPCKEKINFSLNGIVYSLTRSLLMGDPITITIMTPLPLPFNS